MKTKMICNMRSAVLMLWLLATTALSAQNISVASFRLLANDLTANTTGTMERDQNGETAALIKVVTTQQGFVFDGGMVGIVKTKQGVGEVWVYVPHGIKKITIQHPQLGVLRDYYFPIPIEKARTYELVLSTGRVETVVTHSVNKQFVVFKVTPTDAVVELNDETLTVDGEGCASKGVPYGTYSYRVSCANYHTEAGKVTVNAAGKAEVKVTLRPNFGWVKFTGDTDLDGADVYIDNERAGKMPLVSDKLKSGEHRVKIVKEMYRTYERQVTVRDNETTELNVEMTPNFADVTLTADAESEIWIDGERRGKGRWNGRLEIGEYVVEVKKDSHRPSSEILRINTIGERTMELKSPTPIYASLEVSSTPLYATVYIDGVEVGETPLIKSDILVGSHRVTFKKEGYGSVEKSIVLEEGVDNQLSAELSNMEEITITSEPAGATVEIGGEVKGQTPLTTTLQQGSYLVSLSHKGYKSYGVYRKIPSSGNESFHFKLEKLEGRKAAKPQNVISKSKSAAKKYKMTGWGGMLDIGVGYSDISILNYGGELGISYGGFSLSAGVRSHLMGYYHVTYNDDHDLLESQQIQLLRFSTKMGYTLGLGRYIRITPQVGLVYGPSYFMGKEYLTGEIFLNPNSEKVITDVDFSPSEEYGDIQRFIDMRYGVVAGARFELGTRNAGFGVYATPEYLHGEGFKLNVGLLLRF